MGGVGGLLRGDRAVVDQRGVVAAARVEELVQAWREHGRLRKASPAVLRGAAPLVGVARASLAPRSRPGGLGRRGNPEPARAGDSAT
jgi:hypothetical protein